MHYPGVPRRNLLSLERKLPLLITSLLVVSTAAAVGFAYREVRRSALDAARQRLQGITQQLAALSAPTVAQRMADMHDSAATPALAGFLSVPDEVGLRASEGVVRRLRTPADSAFPAMLWNAARKPLLIEGELPRGDTAGAFSPAALPDSTGIGRFASVGGRPAYWMAVPVRGQDGRTLGWLAQLRGVGSPAVAKSVQTLVGEGINIYYANRTGGRWIALDGTFTASPPGWPFAGAREYLRGTRRHYGHAAPIRGTPWTIVAEEPLAAVLARPDAFLRRSALAGVLLCLLGGMGAWLLSRSITRPLARLRAGTDAIAGGDYARRIDLDRADELGVLADGFNRMAGQVQSSHAALTEQYQTAQSLAAELERANQELELAVGEAQAARDEAEEANRTKSDFLATMSHEIRTPINAMVGYAELLQMGLSGPLSEEAQRQLERIRLSGRHLMGLVDQVLDFARIESGVLRVALHSASPAAAVQTALTVVRPQAESKGVRLQPECGDSTARYLGDPQRVEQILVNLLSNAIKFTESGGSVRVDCGAAERPAGEGGPRRRCVTIVVEDSGVGIAPEQLARVFEPFVQLESGYTRRHEGTGLGLAISQRLARSMGGEVRVESELGRGSRFTLWLPAAPEAVSGVGAAGTAAGEMG